MAGVTLSIQSLSGHSSLAPAGPAWFGMLMGTSILTTAGVTHGWPPALSYILLGLAWLMGMVLGGTFIIRLLKESGAWAAVTATSSLSAWGMVGMGLMALGQATAIVLGSTLAWKINALLWLAGTFIGVTGLASFLPALLQRNPDLGDPSFAWGLLPVTPMVSAAVAGKLASNSPWPEFFSAATASFFTLAFSIAIPLFTWLYIRILPSFPPLAVSATAFIPLGVMGQSTFTVQLMGELFNAPSTAALYGTTMLSIGAPLMVYAYVSVIRGMRMGMDFNPTWWGMTFPVGTCVMGSFQLSVTTGAVAWQWVSVGLLVLLTLNWCMAATGTTHALISAKF